jgi:hypothetical protein
VVFVSGWSVTNTDIHDGSILHQAIVGANRPGLHIKPSADRRLLRIPTLRNQRINGVCENLRLPDQTTLLDLLRRGINRCGVFKRD